MRRSTQIRRALPIAISMVAVTWLAPLSAEQSAAPPRQDGVTSGLWTVRPTDVMAECDRQTGGAEATRAAFDLTSTEFDRAFLTYVRAQFNDR